MEIFKQTITTERLLIVPKNMDCNLGFFKILFKHGHRKIGYMHVTQNPNEKSYISCNLYQDKAYFAKQHPNRTTWLPDTEKYLRNNNDKL